MRPSNHSMRHSMRLYESYMALFWTTITSLTALWASSAGWVVKLVTLVTQSSQYMFTKACHFKYGAIIIIIIERGWKYGSLISTPFGMYFIYFYPSPSSIRNVCSYPYNFKQFKVVYAIFIMVCKKKGLIAFVFEKKNSIYKKNSPLG